MDPAGSARLPNKDASYLDDLEDDGVFGENAEDVQDAHDHPRLHRRQPLGLGRVGRHRVEYVDQDEE
jgi:hypothetical protein